MERPLKRNFRIFWGSQTGLAKAWGTIFGQTKKIQQAIRSSKDNRDAFSAAGVYRKLCFCGKIYIGTTMGKRLKERKIGCRLGQTERFVVTEKTLINVDHGLHFDNRRLVALVNGYHNILVREATDIQLNWIWNPRWRSFRDYSAHLEATMPWLYLMALHVKQNEAPF